MRRLLLPEERFTKKELAEPYVFREISLIETRSCPLGCSSVESASGFGVVDPELLADIPGKGVQRAVAALRAGEAVIIRGTPHSDGTVHLGDPRASTGSQTLARIPAHRFHAKELYRALPAVMVSADTAKRLGLETEVIRVILRQAGMPSPEDIDRAMAVAARAGVELTVETGFHSQLGLGLLAAGAASALVTIAGVAISVALSGAEGRADLATLAAIGAQPRRRRAFAAAQGLLVGGVGSLSGIVLGGFLAFAARTTVGAPEFVVPWANLAVAAIAVPVFAAGCAALFTRADLPMVERLE